MPEPTAVLAVETDSGTTYLFSEGMKYVKRVTGGDAHSMRRDGEWIELWSSTIAMGQPMILMLTGVADIGLTQRVTSAVTSIQAVN